VARFGIFSQGRQREVNVRLIRAPAGSDDAEIAIEGFSPLTGASVAELSPRLAQRLRLPSNLKGVAVVDVARNSPAESVGIRPRDVVREVNGAPIDNVETLRLASAQNTRWWRFTIERDGRIVRQVFRY
jgi:C-terminal processing protease CtpA/Prc